MPRTAGLWRLATAVAARALCLAIPLCSLPVSAQDKAPGASQQEAEGSCDKAYPRLDWTATVTEGEAGLRSQRCQGSYLDPLRDSDTSQDPALADIEATAERSELEGDIVRLSGGVEAQQGYRVIRAADAEYDRVTGRGTLLGDVELREPGLLIRGATGTFYSETGAASLTAAQLVVHESHVHGGADLVVRREDGIIELDDSYYTYCPPQQDSWMLHSGELEIDLEEGVATARDAKIEMGGVPVLYTPYLRFPIDDRRKSGFLWPEVGNDSNGGLDVATPYYFNLAPNYDATLTPRFIADRGLLTELEMRYLSHQLGYWEVGGAWIGGDDEYQDEFPDRDGDRWLAAVEQYGLFKKRFRTNIDFTKTADDEYFSDIGTTSLELTQSTYLLQAGEVDYLGDNWLASLRLEEFQTIARDVENDPYSKLPQLSLKRGAAPELFAPNLLLDSSYAYFDHGEDLTGHRLYNAVGANYPMQWLWGFLTPTAKYRQLNYDLDDDILFEQQQDDTPDVGAPLFSLDGGLYFERDTAWGLQTLEPRLFYLWSDFEEQDGLPDFDTSELTFTYNQLFRETRFSGQDRIDDANQVSAGITTRFIDTDTGSEKLYASIGQIYYFDDRRVNVGAASDADFEGSSAIALEFGVSPREDLSLRSSWLWNTDEDELDQTSAQLSYSGTGRMIFNLGYSFRRNRGTSNNGADLEQVDISTYFPVNREWSLFLRSLYDLEDSERINDMFGIEYNNCCWRTRIVHQRFLDQKNGRDVTSLVEYENATYIEFQLKGLGGVGTRVTDMLEEFIRGYEDRDE
ncbi:MAG: LPS-assembly protein LptD [Halieaceae bacterium]